MCECVPHSILGLLACLPPARLRACSRAAVAVVGGKASSTTAENVRHNVGISQRREPQAPPPAPPPLLLPPPPPTTTPSGERERESEVVKMRDWRLAPGALSHTVILFLRRSQLQEGAQKFCGGKTIVRRVAEFGFLKDDKTFCPKRIADECRVGHLIRRKSLPEPGTRLHSTTPLTADSAATSLSQIPCFGEFACTRALRIVMRLRVIA